MAKAKSISKKNTKPTEEVATVKAAIEEVEPMSGLDILKVLARTQGVDQVAEDGSIVKQDGSVIAPE